MRIRLRALAALCALVLAPAFAADPERPRPATVADLPRPPLKAAGSVGTPVQAAQSAQIVYLDPTTQTISSRPPPSDGRKMMLVPSRTVDLSLRVTPEGYLYIDTRGVGVATTAVLAADGTVHLDCGHPADHPSHRSGDGQ